MTRTKKAIIGTGEMSRRIRNFNWEGTSLGSISVWPESLVTSVNLVLQSPVPVVMLWGPDGVMIYNDAYSVFAGKRHPGLLGSAVAEGWPEVADFNRNVMNMVRAKGKTLEYKDHQLTLYRNNKPEEVWMDLSYSPIIDESGKPNGVLAIVLETTGSVLARRQVEYIANFNKTITDNATTGLMIMDENHYCTYMNPAAENITGYTLEQIHRTHKTLHDIVHPIHPDGSPYPIEDCPTSKALLHKKRVLSEDFFIRPDGSSYPVSIMTTPIIRDGRMAGIVEEIRDITSEKAAERKILELNKELETRVVARTAELTAANKELGRSNEELQDFAYVASHDLQEPLRKIAAFANLIDEDFGDLLPEEAHRYLNGLRDSSARMRTLIDDLLTYSRVTTQARPFETVDLTALVHDALEDLQARSDETHAEVTVGKLGHVEGDRLQLRLLFQNLLSNAMKYAKQNVPPKIVIRAQAAGNSREIYVTDNGIGFDPRYTDRIFTIFQRLHGKNEYEGTGVGLAIVKKIVDRHGGSITAESKPGKGSTFIVTLPVSQNHLTEKKTVTV